MTRRRPSTLWPVSIALLIAVATALTVALTPSAVDQSSPPAPTPTLPVLTPQALLPLAPEDARAANAAQPFVAGNFPAAAPYRFTGDGAAAARAADCLAAALLYEAGDDADGQRAVAQVVLNRVRHPAFPASICGVVFEGAERRTGCQFTFTCDGALARRYSREAWDRARGIAIDFMNGAIDPRVGLATHYHTDWVRPYWSSSLDKLAQVGTHLFFRWRGYWGTPPAFRRDGGAPEPLVRRLAVLSVAHSGAPDAPVISPSPVDEAALAAASAAAVRQIIPQAERRLGDTIMLVLTSGQDPDSFPAIAEAACGARSYCKVMGWTDASAVPDAEPMSDAARAAMAFSYLRNEGANLERALWNCRTFPRAQQGQCMRR